MHIINEILQHFSGLVYTICGALIGWGCTELSRHLANSYQKKQTLNTALSLLLELYFQTKRIQEMHAKMQEIFRWYMTLLEENPLYANEKEFVNSILNEMITPMITDFVSGDVEKLSSDYEDALKNLSSYYPVAAYRLRGRADIHRILVDMRACYRKIIDKVPFQISECDGLVDSMQTFIQPSLMQDNLSSLKEEIYALAKEANHKQRKEIKTTLKNIDTPNPEMEQYISLLKEKITQGLGGVRQ